MSAGDRYLGDGTRVRIDGVGAPLVLVHGVGMDLTMWQPMAAILAERHRVICYDMQGHGDSPKPVGPYRLTDFVAQLRRLAKELSLDAFDLAGFSMGGLVAQGFAAAHPDMLRRLVLLNTVYNRGQAARTAIAARVAEVRTGGFPASVETAIERWFTPDFRRLRTDVVDAVRRQMLDNDLDAYAAAYEVFATADAELVDAVANIACPTLVITGAEDQRSTAAMARALAARIPNAQLEILPGQRHLTPFETPDHLAGAVSVFLQTAGIGDRRVAAS